jgi:hypothetical protein
MLTRSTLLIAAFAFSALAADHLAGTWKLNTAKSKYVNLKTPKDEMVTYTPTGQGWHYEAKSTVADQQPTRVSYTYTRDNVDMPISGSPYADTLTADTLTLENGGSDNSTGTFKRDGKVVGTVKRTISKDGKTMTVKASLIVAELCPVSVCGAQRERGKMLFRANYNAVYDKQ